MYVDGRFSEIRSHITYVVNGPLSHMVLRNCPEREFPITSMPVEMCGGKWTKWAGNKTYRLATDVDQKQHKYRKVIILLSKVSPDLSLPLWNL